MAMLVSEVKSWIDGLAPDDEIGVDDGGLALINRDGSQYLEVGGILVEYKDGAPPYDAATATGMYDREG